MKYENLINPDLIPTKIKEDFQFIQNKIQEANGEAYLVGGAVRDLVMEKSPHEYDITTSLPPETIQKIFNKVKETGIQHGTVLVLLKNENYEFTTYRTEQGYSDGRRPDEVKYSTSLEEDLMRRDFTMNALAMNLEDYSVLDFHNGINDIKNKTIRTIGNPIERFSEDGLRPIRAIRFLSSLEFRIEENTYKAIHETKEITSKISKERFHDEILKILKNNSPYLSIKELFNNKIFSLFVDNVNEDYNIENLKIIDKLIKSPVGLRLSFILKILLEGKENYSEEGEKILKELKFSRENIKDTLFFLSFINEPILDGNLSSKDFRKILSKIKFYSKNRYNEFIDAILDLFLNSIGEEFYNKVKDSFREIITNKDPLLISELNINGNTISQKLPTLDKKRFGEVLNLSLEKVLENPNLNTEENLIKLINEYIK